MPQMLLSLFPRTISISWHCIGIGILLPSIFRYEKEMHQRRRHQMSLSFSLDLRISHHNMPIKWDFLYQISPPLLFLPALFFQRRKISFKVILEAPFQARTTDLCANLKNKQITHNCVIKRTDGPPTTLSSFSRVIQSFSGPWKETMRSANKSQIPRHVHCSRMTTQGRGKRQFIPHCDPALFFPMYDVFAWPSF